MSELVERLRRAAQEGREIIEPWQLDPWLYDDAADEIEYLRAENGRLRAALEQAVDDFGDSHCVCEDTKQMCIAALTAPQREG